MKGKSLLRHACKNKTEKDEKAYNYQPNGCTARVTQVCQFHFQFCFPLIPRTRFFQTPSGLNETKFPGFEYFGNTENSNRSCPRALCFHLTLTTNPHGVFDRHSTNVRSSVKVSRGRSAKSWGLRASVSFLPLSYPSPPFFRSRPISRASKNKKIGFLVQKTPRKRLLRRLKCLLLFQFNLRGGTCQG